MFHCHILEHENIGMMGMWHIMDGDMPMCVKGILFFYRHLWQNRFLI